MYSEGSFGDFSWDRRCTRRSAIWSTSSPFINFLKHICVLDHWATRYYFVERLDNAPTAPYFRRLDHFLQGTTHWNKRRIKTFRRLAKWTRRSSGLHFFILLSLFVPFYDVVSMLSFKYQILDT
uniref:Uncharacterized protein n=1 Tax=Solanum tuberosum TaxID=4113 RepID=M1DW30_SOLTU